MFRSVQSAPARQHGPVPNSSPPEPPCIWFCAVLAFVNDVRVVFPYAVVWGAGLGRAFWLRSFVVLQAAHRSGAAGVPPPLGGGPFFFNPADPQGIT